MLALLTALSALQCRRTESSGDAAPYFSVTFSGDSAMDGRLLLLISTDDSTEPRFQISDGPGTQQVFGLDVNDWQPGSEAVFTKEDFGYPVQSLSELPAGEYFVQVLLQKYETFRRADGHVVQLPMDQGEGRQWNRAPGNPYSKPRKVHFDPAKAGNISIELDQIIPPIEPPKDTEYVKHIRIRSKMLSEFWGRDMYLGAHVLLPQGWAEHPDVKYPLAIFHGHFNYDLGGWRTTPPDTTQPCEYNERFQVDCYNRLVQQEAYDFYKMWTGPNFPRVIVIDIQHANPYYDDSYAVNSANLGPYGDAITYELIPYIEQQFRGIGQGWARFLYGGSTGGWEALAAQVFYPTEYNGCYAACPDPIDFRAYTVVNIYEDENAYYTEGPFRKTLRPGTRNALGHISATLRDANYKELALGTRSRSGDQWDIWEAVYSPAGKDGYPQPIWDKRSGVIDKKVAAHWRENYDLAYILKRDWPKNGADWRGKIHLYCGDMDNYYLNNAVYLTEEILEKVSNPPYDGEVDYGDRAEH
ncbi:MAG TPA: alpha/beta hydrolase-fold protein, partial [Saprospiraceae bacterium]|nr:alpha/beta hydrolase-fold protein [Saprospiraceae bacterium]